MLTIPAVFWSFRTFGYQPGDAAMEFRLKNIDGKIVGLRDLGTAGAIVVFTCNHCPYSKLYEDRIIALDKKYKSKGYPVIAINPNDAAQYPDDGYDSMVVRAREKEFTFPYLHDESQEVARAYGAERTPHVYIVQFEKKKSIVKYIGAIDNNAKDEASVSQKYVENAMDELLSGKEVSVKTSKAIGCGIKWKAQ